MKSTKNFSVRLGHSSWGLGQTFAVRVFPDANQQLANGGLYPSCIKGTLGWWFA
jgi:hypothetical protein